MFDFLECVTAYLHRWEEQTKRRHSLDDTTRFHLRAETEREPAPDAHFETKKISKKNPKGMAARVTQKGDKKKLTGNSRVICSLLSVTVSHAAPRSRLEPAEDCASANDRGPGDAVDI